MAIIVVALALAGCTKAEPEYATDFCDFAESYVTCRQDGADPKTCKERSMRESARVPAGIPEGCR